MHILAFTYKKIKIILKKEPSIAIMWSTAKSRVGSFLLWNYQSILKYSHTVKFKKKNYSKAV